MRRVLCLLFVVFAGCDDNVAPSQTGMMEMMPDSGICNATREPIRAETCDTRDNDCDGRIDEDFNLQTSTVHCGACGNACDFDNVDAICRDGECVALGGCPPGTFDVDEDLTNGCEGTCQGTAQVEEGVALQLEQPRQRHALVHVPEVVRAHLALHGLA